MKICCPICESTRIKKNGHIHNGKQNHYCKKCGRQFVENPEQRLISEDEREQINEIYFKRLWDSDEKSKLVKLSDKLDNLRDAINCPSLQKRQRTIMEAEEFYLSLCETLENFELRKKLFRLLKMAIDKLRKFGNEL